MLSGADRGRNREMGNATGDGKTSFCAVTGRSRELPSSLSPLLSPLPLSLALWTDRAAPLYSPDPQLVENVYVRIRVIKMKK